MKNGFHFISALQRPWRLCDERVHQTLSVQVGQRRVFLEAVLLQREKFNSSLYSIQSHTGIYTDAYTHSVHITDIDILISRQACTQPPHTHTHTHTYIQKTTKSTNISYISIYYDIAKTFTGNNCFQLSKRTSIGKTYFKEDKYISLLNTIL